VILAKDAVAASFCGRHCRVSPAFCLDTCNCERL